MKTTVNLELLAKVLGVYSVSHATQSGAVLHITYRESEDDNSGWFDANTYEIQHLYKLWAETQGYNVLSDTTGAYVTKLPKKSINDCDFSYLDKSEIKAVRLVCEKIYEIVKD